MVELSGMVEAQGVGHRLLYIGKGKMAFNVFMVRDSSLSVQEAPILLVNTVKN